MPEVKRVVRPVEVDYLCDACGKGMLEHSGDMDPETGALEHQCMICNHVQIFNWKRYPRIDHIGEDEAFQAALPAASSIMPGLDPATAAPTQVPPPRAR